MLNYRKIYITFLIIVTWAGIIQARDNSFEYNIIPSDSNLAVWVNLSPFLTSTRIDDLKDGEQYSIYGMISLNRAKKFYGSELIDKKDFFINTSFFILTEDFQIEKFQNSEKILANSQPRRNFTNFSLIQSLFFFKGQTS